jgi:hypothetical protein
MLWKKLNRISQNSKRTAEGRGQTSVTVPGPTKYLPKIEMHLMMADSLAKQPE